MTALARLWFPLALIVLLLLALPGLVLFALHLLGLAAPVNQWLQDRFSLSYHIPVPSWAGAVLLLVPLLLILLYFLKLKRRPLHVPSTFLWRKSIEDLHVNTLFQRLRENVLLLLQLLTVLVLVYALMGFQVHGRSVEGKHYILMIDNSASMNATDVAPNRLHQAKQEALQEIDSHTDNDSGMVIVFNSSAEIRQSYTQDRSLLRSAVENIQPTHRPTVPGGGPEPGRQPGQSYGLHRERRVASGGRGPQQGLDLRSPRRPGHRGFPLLRRPFSRRAEFQPRQSHGPLPPPGSTGSGRRR